MKVVPVVLVSGYKGSGKDSFSAAVNRKIHDAGFWAQTAPLSMPLKEMVSQMLSIPYEICFGDIHAKEGNSAYGKTVRHWLQWFGTEVFREGVHPDYWVHQLLRRIVSEDKGTHSPYPPAWIVPDWRFPNELQLLRAVLVDRGQEVDGMIPMDAYPRKDQRFKIFAIKVNRASTENSGDMHPSELAIGKLGPAVRGERVDAGLLALSLDSRNGHSALFRDFTMAEPSAEEGADSPSGFLGGRLRQGISRGSRSHHRRWWQRRQGEVGMLPFKEAMWVPLILAVEGIIGCGKSTLVRSICSLLKFKPFFEPVEGNPYLADFYKVVTPPGWEGRIKNVLMQKLGTTPNAAWIIGSIMSEFREMGALYHHMPSFMQLFLLTRRFHLYTAALSADAYGYQGAMLDRSLQGDTVFARMLHEDGWIDDRDMATYWGHWQRFKEFAPNPHAFIFLDCTPETAIERMKIRARSEEVGVPIEYLQRLAEHYDLFLEEMKSRCTIIRIPYDPPRKVYDAREFPEVYPEFQAAEDPKMREVLAPDKGSEIIDVIKDHLPQYQWFGRHRGNTEHMLSEVAQ
jgi:deoxyadenosine/deoxycytidine kinase